MHLLLRLLHRRLLYDESVQFLRQALLVVVCLLGGHINSLQAFTVRKSPIVNLDTPAGNDVYVFKFVIYYSIQIKFSLRDV